MALTHTPKAEQKVVVAKCLGCRKDVREPSQIVGLFTGGSALVHAGCKARTLRAQALAWLRTGHKGRP